MAILDFQFTLLVVDYFGSFAFDVECLGERLDYPVAQSIRVYKGQSDACRFLRLFSGDLVDLAAGLVLDRPSCRLPIAGSNDKAVGSTVLKESANRIPKVEATYRALPEAALEL
jgi:hypothetical protein